jgi:hypothetical protein
MPDLINRLACRAVEWRIEVAQLYERGFDYEAATLQACAADLEGDLRSVNGGE